MKTLKTENCEFRSFIQFNFLNWVKFVLTRMFLAESFLMVHAGWQRLASLGIAFKLNIHPGHLVSSTGKFDQLKSCFQNVKLEWIGLVSSGHYQVTLFDWRWTRQWFSSKVSLQSFSQSCSSDTFSAFELQIRVRMIVCDFEWSANSMN